MLTTEQLPLKIVRLQNDYDFHNKLNNNKLKNIFSCDIIGWAVDFCYFY